VAFGGGATAVTAAASAPAPAPAPVAAAAARPVAPPPAPGTITESRPFNREEVIAAEIAKMEQQGDEMHEEIQKKLSNPK
ncbi:MAG: hypothetical protein KGL74_11550, partial [Elusimicrobia bacterium]|nr:hypothetical protein [Elusimicrobiota bacterium]